MLASLPYNYVIYTSFIVVLPVAFLLAGVAMFVHRIFSKFTYLRLDEHDKYIRDREKEVEKW